MTLLCPLYVLHNLLKSGACLFFSWDFVVGAGVYTIGLFLVSRVGIIHLLIIAGLDNLLMRHFAPLIFRGDLEQNGSSPEPQY